MYLDVKTDFSFLKAYGSPDQVVARALELGHKWVGIADVGGAWGHIPFWNACKGKVLPIFGVQLAVVSKFTDKDATHDLVTLLAMDDEGLRNQYEAISVATGQFYYRPRLTWDQVSKIKKNVIIVNRVTPASEKHIPKAAYVGFGLDPSYTRSLCEGRPNALSIAPQYPRADDAEAFQLMCAIGSGQRAASVPITGRYMMNRGELEATLDLSLIHI